jgi:nitroreductase
MVKKPQEKIDNIIEAISLAPTSSGLQPFEVIVITNQEVKKSDLFLGINL